MTTRPPRSASEAERTSVTTRRDDPGRRRFGALLAGLALAAAVWAVAGSAWILPELSANSDEGLYLLQADALRSGQLAPSAPTVDADAYRPWFSVVRNGTYVLKYAPVHASVLATATAVTSSARPALAVIAAAQVVLVVALARELGAGRRAALLAGALFALAPLVLQLDITYLPYGSSLALLLGSAVGARRAQRTGRWPPALSAGLCWGTAAFARPYDAALFGGALLLALASMPRPDGRPRWTGLGRLAAWAGLGALPPLVALLAFNHAMTGDVLHLPFQLLDAHDAPGLGLRRALPSDRFFDYTPARALGSLGRNLLLVTVWAGGGLLGCALAVTALLRRRLAGGGVVLAVLLVWPVGYALFWGSYVSAFLWDGALFIGPFYFLPMVAMLAIPAAVTLDDLWRWRPAVAAVAALGAIALAAGVAVPRLDEQRQRSEQRTAVAEAVHDAVRPPALVFVPPLFGPYLQNPLSFLRNRAQLDGDVVYALDRGGDLNARVQRQHPSRRAYRLVLPSGWSDQPGFRPDVVVEHIAAPTADGR